MHAVAGPKPWQAAAAYQVTRRNAYVRLLRRLLVENDAAVRVAPSDVAAWLRPGMAGRLSLAVNSMLPRNTGALARARKLLQRS